MLNNRVKRIHSAKRTSLEFTMRCQQIYVVIKWCPLFYEKIACKLRHKFIHLKPEQEFVAELRHSLKSDINFSISFLSVC